VGNDITLQTSTSQAYLFSYPLTEMFCTFFLYLKRHLGECFNHSIPVKRRLTRYKHWFQDESVRTAPIVNDTLVIAMFRNPFEWIEAMRKRVSFATEQEGYDMLLFFHCFSR
jgi:hypothetical protein